MGYQRYASGVSTRIAIARNAARDQRRLSIVVGCAAAQERRRREVTKKAANSELREREHGLHLVASDSSLPAQIPLPSGNECQTITDFQDIAI